MTTIPSIPSIPSISRQEIQAGPRLACPWSGPAQPKERCRAEHGTRNEPFGLGEWSVGLWWLQPWIREDDLVILTRHASRPRLRAWHAHLEMHEVTRAPHRVDGQVIWLAPWAGVFHPGTQSEDLPAPAGKGLWTALASAVGSGAPADS